LSRSRAESAVQAWNQCDDARKLHKPYHWGMLRVRSRPRCIQKNSCVASGLSALRLSLPMVERMRPLPALHHLRTPQAIAAAHRSRTTYGDPDPEGHTHPAPPFESFGRRLSLPIRSRLELRPLICPNRAVKFASATCRSRCASGSNETILLGGLTPPFDNHGTLAPTRSVAPWTSLKCNLGLESFSHKSNKFFANARM
jgi:hypothetical protein